MMSMNVKFREKTSTFLMYMMLSKNSYYSLTHAIEYLQGLKTLPEEKLANSYTPTAKKRSQQ